jgi:hypothetical protein
MWIANTELGQALLDMALRQIVSASNLKAYFVGMNVRGDSEPVRYPVASVPSCGHGRRGTVFQLLQMMTNSWFQMHLVNCFIKLLILTAG